MMLPYQQSFLDWLAPLAIADMKRTKILASLTIAQGIIESDWGRSILATQAHNYFGIKVNAEWHGDSISKLTGEVYNGVPTKITALFRKYPSREVGVRDHGDFLLRPYYTAVVGEKDYRKACQAIYRYATQPKYPQILIDTIEKFDLTRFDKEVPMFKVFLSPSSQDKNLYATATHPSEERICNLIADKVEALLRAQGIDVMQNDPAGGPADHTVKSNAYKPDLHVPIHTNAGGGEGCEVFCWDPANLTSRSTKASKAIYAEVSALTPYGDRGVKKNQSFYEIIHTTAPCAYCELYYHDNLTDATWIINHVTRLSEAIVRGIMAYKQQVAPNA